MPYSLVHPPQNNNNGYIHPMEVVTDLYMELEICVKELHEGYLDWQKRPWEERHLLRRWWYFHKSKEAYYNTPKKDRPNFFFKKT